MSGRLIILPKKSWHPGKRENIEKVLRDERLAAEEAAAARERAREITQEGIVETLSKKRSAEGGDAPAKVTEKSQSRKRGRDEKKEGVEAMGGAGQGWGRTPQHVNLFSDAEREADKTLGQNADHQQEKQEEDLRLQRRSGLAPTPLGEGAAELRDKDSQPWYTQRGGVSAHSDVSVRTVRLGREVTGREAEEALERDEGRKGRADPLGSLFRSGARQTVGSRLSAMPPPKAFSPTRTSFLERRKDVDKGKSVREKKSSKKKKAKDKKRKKHKSTRSNSGEADCKDGDGEENLSRRADAGAEDEKRHLQLEELRRRRYAREGGERNREIQLLAQRQMAGQPFPDERSMTYNNQYNASVARQNRRG